jgi:transglutaminase/protease-like cytokinesis protein 3
VVYWTKDEPNPLEKSYMQSAYGALINGKCVCQGYAEAYKRLLNSQNIICEVICGKVKGSKVYHAWNVVSFDGVEYYHVDVTWDAKNAGVKRDKYFCLSDADMVKDRLWTRLSYVSCNGKEDILKIAKQQIESQKLRYTAKGIGEVYLK